MPDLGPFFNVYVSPEEWGRLKALRKKAGLGSFVLPVGEPMDTDAVWQMVVLMNDLLGREMDSRAAEERGA